MRNCLARRHWAFKEIHILHRAVAEVKKEVIVNFGLTARQFNGLNVQLDQAVECWREGLKFQVANLDERIKALPKTIAILEKKIAKETKSWTKGFPPKNRPVVVYYPSKETSPGDL